jgi:hypothetical protein
MPPRAAPRILVAVVVLAVALAWPPASLAALTLTTVAAPVFSDNLDLGDQTPSYTAALTAKDTSSGASPGWRLTITSTQFTTGGGTPHTLATTASKVTAVTSVCAVGPCVNPTNSVAYPVTVPAAGVPPAAVRFFNAAANTGQGTFTVTPTVKVSVPQNSYAGTYTSTLTLAIVSGP